MTKWETITAWCKERWAYLAAALGLLVWGFLLGRREKVPSIKAPTVDTTKIKVEEQQKTTELDQQYTKDRIELENKRHDQLAQQTQDLAEDAPGLVIDGAQLNDYLIGVGKDVRKK